VSSNAGGPYYVIPGKQGGSVSNPVNTNVNQTDPAAPPFNVEYDVTSTETYWLFAQGKLP
jgi:hypothetical protein